MDTLKINDSGIARQNVLNNKFAIQEMQKALGFKGIEFEGQYLFTKSQVARFLEITERTVDNYITKYSLELEKNGYEVFTGKRLQDLKSLWGNETDFVTHMYTSNIGFFTFRAFLNLTMLVSESDKARSIRKVILDIVIDVINKKVGGSTKYINQRDERYLLTAYQGENYRKEFTDALRDCIDMGNAKYPIYTNKIYEAIFREKAQEYRKVLRLSQEENVRETMYTEILDLIASFETGFAEELVLETTRLGRKLTSEEVDDLFQAFANRKHWKPMMKRARDTMASRDYHFRDAVHSKLKEHIDSVNTEDFERFLGEQSKKLEERITEYKKVFDRLKLK